MFNHDDMYQIFPTLVSLLPYLLPRAALVVFIRSRPCMGVPCVLMIFVFAWSAPSVCTACPSGTFCNVTGLTAAVPCPPGSICPTSGLNASVPCPQGQFCPVAGLVRGVSCPSGWFTALLASTSCSPCALGWLASPDNAACVSVCPAGSYLNLTASQCVTCSGGVFCLGGANSAISCPAGMLSHP